MVNLIKYTIILFIVSQLTLHLFSQGKIDVIAQYSCNNSDVTGTIVRDTDNNGVYDTYTVTWCNGSTNSYPILAIGDIRRWPPTGIPTREIIESNQSNKTFTEAYFTMSSSIILCWFVRRDNCDTVYYYDNRPELMLLDVNEYQSNNILFKLMPIPANDFVAIDYTLNESSWVTITLYNEIGIAIDNIQRQFISQGSYNIRYNLNGLSSGNYFITVKLGMEEIFTKPIIIAR